MINLVIIFSFIYPQQFPLRNNVLTGSFCEYRGNHFHTGIDISTFATSGMPVYAPDNGYISYIKQDFLGYGKAIFLQSDSITYVFAHLYSFSDKIKSYLNSTYFRQKHFLKRNKINVNKGEIIAYTGRSGTYIPHLHFEMRSKNNNPINPLNYFYIEDTIAPEIRSVIFEPADDTCLINGRHEIVQVRCSKRGKNFIIPDINICGDFYISIEIIDKINSKTARLFIKKINIFSDKKEIFDFSIDSISFNLSKISPLLFRKDLPLMNDNYIFYPHAKHFDMLYKRPLRVLNSIEDSLLRITVKDNYGNTSKIIIKIKNTGISNINEDFVKISKVNEKICIILSGKYNKIKNAPDFDLYRISNNYLYYVYNAKKNLHTKIKIKNKKINANIIYIDSVHTFSTEDFSVLHKNSVYFMFDTVNNIKINNFITISPLYNFYYANRYLYNPYKVIINGKEDYSLYSFNNKKYVFIKKLNKSDTLFFNLLKSFIIGKDVEKPKYKLLKKKKMSQYTEYKYKIYDSISGIDWIFVSDSNKIYNIPDPQRGILKILKNDKSENFIIKDREGNKTIIYLN